MYKETVYDLAKLAGADIRHRKYPILPVIIKRSATLTKYGFTRYITREIYLVKGLNFTIYPVSLIIQPGP
ncbi:hypothetical protein KDK_41460 [Dictyobacter kobayashii]|uniref:Uncharacterized protein n=1 Tax=Dictyobacter kobayashii TaxID=2014872 RepID=A0A402AMK4_9CHLR|nr:hypothetical protein KDK_41460 [Dictyobacter kobayashii]